MNCPVCDSSGFPADQKKCPQCGSDLEAFYMTRKIESLSNGRLRFGIVMTILLLVVSLVWIITGLAGKKVAGNQTEEPVLSVQQEEFETLQKENVKLKQEIATLKNRITAMTQESVETKETGEVRGKKMKEIEYVVQESETLFGIARRFYGNGFKYTQIARDNNIADPGAIRPGQKLIIKINP